MRIAVLSTAPRGDTVRRILSEYGHTIVNGQSADVMLVQRIPKRNSPSWFVPKILMDLSRDESSISLRTRIYLASRYAPSSIWKSSTYADPGRHNESSTSEHVIRCLDEGEDQPRSEVFDPLPIATLSKLKPLVPYSVGIDFSVKPDLDRERPIDVFFAGYTNYLSTNGPRPEVGPLIARHRLRCCDQLRSMTSLNVVCLTGSDLVSAVQYRKLLAQSKIAVAPYGWGETCYRDYEAVWAGCLLVKPDVRFISESPQHIMCRPDFADLPQIVEELLSMTGEQRRDRAAAALEDFSGRFSEQAIAFRMTDDMEDAKMAPPFYGVPRR